MKTIIFLIAMGFGSVLGLITTQQNELPNAEIKPLATKQSSEPLETFAVFPNPSGNKIFMDLHQNARHKDMSLSLHKINGTMIDYSFVNQTFNAEMSIEHLESGTYLITLHSDKSIFSKILEVN